MKITLGLKKIDFMGHVVAVMGPVSEKLDRIHAIQASPL
jgi:hypothetical protein